MPDGEFGAALQRALEDVLERMFFVDTTGGACAEAETEPPLCARIAFEGDAAGSLSIRISRQAAAAIAADFLAEDPEQLSHRQIEDVVCELTNMVCGAALSRLENGLRLHAPQMLDEPAAEPSPGAAARRLDVGNGSISVLLCFNEAPCCRNEKYAS